MSKVQNERSKVLLTLTDWDLENNGVMSRVTDEQFEAIAEAIIDKINEEGYWQEFIEQAIEEVLEQDEE